MSKRFFGVDFARCEPVVVPIGAIDRKATMPRGFKAPHRGRGSRGDVFRVPDDLKVSCQKCDVCRSPSKRDPAKPRAWLCGSGFSHNDRLGLCVVYRRLDRGLRDGECAGRRCR